MRISTTRPKDLVIHSSQPPDTLLPAIRQIVHAADPQQPISDIRTMDEVVAGETESRTIQMRVLVVFTGVAILLAGLGIYGLLAFTVSMRQQEFGIRIALGAGQGDIFKMVLIQGAYLAVAGLLPGLAVRLHRCQAAAKPACRRTPGRCAYVFHRNRTLPHHHAHGDPVPCPSRGSIRSYRRDAG